MRTKLRKRGIAAFAVAALTIALSGTADARWGWRGRGCRFRRAGRVSVALENLGPGRVDRPTVVQILLMQLVFQPAIYVGCLWIGHAQAVRH